MSNTSITRTRRKLRKLASGKKRKKLAQKFGSTPAFPIHPDGKKPAKEANA